MFGDDIDDQRVAHQSDQHYEREEERDQPGVGEEGVLLSFLFVPTSAQRVVHIGAVEPELLGGVPEVLRGEHCERDEGWIVREVRGGEAKRAGCERRQCRERKSVCVCVSVI